MRNRWNPEDAASCTEILGEVGAGGEARRNDRALCAYVSRLIGREPTLVLHGGGNSSVKTRTKLPWSEDFAEIHVKGSGFDMKSLTTEEFTTLDHERVLALAMTEAIDDDRLRRHLSAARLDCKAPFPSVESLLHALIPHRFVLHNHADVVLEIGRSAKAWNEIAADMNFAVLDYVMPGHRLARAVAENLDEIIHRRGLILVSHGMVTWGDDAKSAYDGMIDAVTHCERAASKRLARAESTNVRRDLPRLSAEERERRAMLLAPRIRAALSTRTGDIDNPWHRVVLCRRADESLLESLACENFSDLCSRGVVTPDHVIHTRRHALVIDDTPRDDGEEFSRRLEAAVSAFIDRSREMLAEHESAWLDKVKVQDDALAPRVVAVPGVGIFAAGDDRAQAEIAADLSASSIRIRRRGEAMGGFCAIGEADVLEMEFWGLERAKLDRRPRRPLEGRVALVTGAAGAIGSRIAEELAEAGAFVFLADRPGTGDDRRLPTAVERIAGKGSRRHAAPLPFDVTSAEACERAFAEASLIAGGVDLLVLSHGMAHVAALDTLDPGKLEQVFSVNALGTFFVLSAFLKHVRIARRGGDVVLLSTKNVADPGADFSAYSASKAAAHQLARVAALEMAGDDVRVNLIAPDAVFGDADFPSRLWQEVGPDRARSKGFSPAELPEHYRLRNLLRSPVTSEHVARAVLFFAQRKTPTTGAVFPVDGGLPGAFPR